MQLKGENGAECKTCTNWQMRDNPAMARFGFARCTLGAKWTFLAPGFRCERYSAAGADVVKKREVFLKGKGA